MYAHLKPTYKSANTAKDYERYLAQGVYDLPPGQIPNEALLARNEYRLQQNANNSNIPTATRANLAGGVRYTDNRGIGNRINSNLSDYWNRYANNWNVAFGGNDSYAHEGDDWTRTAGQWANRIGFDTLTTAATLGAGSALAPALRTGIGAAGRVASGLASRAVPLGTRALGAARTAANTGLGAARNAANAGLWAVDAGLYGTLRGAQTLGRFGRPLLQGIANQGRSGALYTRNFLNAAKTPSQWRGLFNKGVNNAYNTAANIALPGRGVFRPLTAKSTFGKVFEGGLRAVPFGVGVNNVWNAVNSGLQQYEYTGNPGQAFMTAGNNYLSGIPVSPINSTVFSLAHLASEATNPEYGDRPFTVNSANPAAFYLSSPLNPNPVQRAQATADLANTRTEQLPVSSRINAGLNKVIQGINPFSYNDPNINAQDLAYSSFNDYASGSSQADLIPTIQEDLIAQGISPENAVRLAPNYAIMAMSSIPNFVNWVGQHSSGLDSSDPAIRQAEQDRLAKVQSYLNAITYIQQLQAQDPSNPRLNAYLESLAAGMGPADRRTFEVPASLSSSLQSEMFAPTPLIDSGAISQR